MKDQTERALLSLGMEPLRAAATAGSYAGFQYRYHEEIYDMVELEDADRRHGKLPQPARR